MNSIKLKVNGERPLGNAIANPTGILYKEVS
jgi:hypothetical protein